LIANATSFWRGFARVLKGIVHPKMRMLSFTHLQVVPNLYEFLSSVEHTNKYFSKNISN